MTPLSLRFAGRELRGGVRGFRIFLACLALGVAAIAAAGSTAEAFRRGLASQASEILGGDLALSVRQRGFNPAEQAVLAKEGRVSYAVASMAMAQAPSGERRLIELRGVNETYPLAGKVTLAGAPSLQAAIAPVNGVAGAVVEQSLLDRLHLKLGDQFPGWEHAAASPRRPDGRARPAVTRLCARTSGADQPWSGGAGRLHGPRPAVWRDSPR